MTSSLLLLSSRSLLSPLTPSLCSRPLQEARALRVAVRSINMSKVVGSTQTERIEGPALHSQTDFVSIDMPLPGLPHGGMWAAGGPRVLLPRTALGSSGSSR